MKIDKTLAQLTKDIPYMELEKLVERKMKEAGVKDSKGAAKAFVAHTRSGKGGDMQWEDEGEEDSHRTIEINITEEETKQIIENASNFITQKFPKVLDTATDELATGLLKDLKDKWPEQDAWQQAVTMHFCQNLEARWGKGLALLRMLLTIFREQGDEAHKKLRRRKIADPATMEVKFRIHARSCQVADEIITLLENGFADGAMARWRTLHELCVTALLISEHGEELAQRFIDHQVIEAKKQMEEYEKIVPNGYKPLSQKDKAALLKDHATALKKYGKEFRTQYGWAAKHLKHPQPTFRDMEAAVKRGTMRSFYQMAGYNVHASARGLYFRLGSLSDVLIAGRSNVGLTEPAQNTAYTLCTINSILTETEQNDVPKITTMKAIVKLRDEIPAAFWKAEQKLARDERKHQRELAAKAAKKAKR